MGYNNKISLGFTALKQPALQVILYLVIYEVAIRSLVSDGVLEMNLALGITVTYLFYLYITLSLLLLIVVYFQRRNRFVYSGVLAVLFCVISFYGLKEFELLALLISLIALVSTFLSYLVLNKSSLWSRPKI
jgi:hypothetical protein